MDRARDPTDFDGDPDALRTQLETALRSSLHRRDDTQAKLSHLADLRARLDAAGLDFEDLAEVERPDKRVLGKARRKVLEQALEGRTMTEAMRDTQLDGSSSALGSGTGTGSRPTPTASTHASPADGTTPSSPRAVRSR